VPEGVELTRYHLVRYATEGSLVHALPLTCVKGLERRCLSMFLASWIDIARKCICCNTCATPLSPTLMQGWCCPLAEGSSHPPTALWASHPTAPSSSVYPSSRALTTPSAPPGDATLRGLPQMWTARSSTAPAPRGALVGTGAEGSVVIDEQGETGI
jgi:hypothetical protein